MNYKIRKELTNYFNQVELIYLLDKLSDSSLEKVYNLVFVTKNLIPTNDNEQVFFGKYFEFKNKSLADEYYKKAIDDNNTFAMLCYGKYLNYYNNGILSQNYIKMAFEKGNGYSIWDIDKKYLISDESLKKAYEYYNSTTDNHDAMFYLGNYLRIRSYYDESNRDKLTESMKKYLLMACEKGNSEAMRLLGEYYEVNRNWENTEKYYIMALSKNNQMAYEWFCRQFKYNEIHLLKILLENNRIMLIDFINEKRSFFDLGYKDDKKKLLEIVNELTLDDMKNITNNNVIVVWNLLREKIDIMEMHFEYSMNGKGFKEAKNDFMDKAIKHYN